MKQQKGLLVYILKSCFGSCDGKANFSSRYDRCILLPSKDFPDVPEIFEVTAEHPAIQIVKRDLFTSKPPYLTAYPVVNGKADKNRMMGGCYIESSDGRFPADYPVPLHDGIE
jgi:hypothetical protein